jgi:hypothetical protein
VTRARLQRLLEQPVVSTALILLVLAVIVVPWMLAVRLVPDTVKLVAIDANIYFDAANRWLADGTWYLDRQLHGPYEIQIGDVLYPPILLYLLLPFQVLPRVLWWAIPLAIAGVALARIRPPRWSWPLLLLCLAWGPAMAQVVKGNPVMWAMAALAVSIAMGWPSTLVLLKPSLFPFALIGIRRRAWWLQLGLLGLLSLPVLGLTVIYPRVILDSQGGGLLYSLNDVPLLLLPVLAGVAAGRLRLPRRIGATSAAEAREASPASAAARPGPGAGAGGSTPAAAGRP